MWAPNARRVSVVGDFNQWDGRRHPMRKRVEAGIWEIFIPGVAARRASTNTSCSAPNGQLLPLKADPVGFEQEHPPATGSRVVGLPRHEWGDADWMVAPPRAPGARRADVDLRGASRLVAPRRTATASSSYDELADQLVPYAKDMGFTHIECLPVSEHPFSGSWGYQPIGLFAPTSRFGSPEAFARFVDRCHQAELGVIIDWVPAHFPTDAHGLARFDGTALYEHEDPRLGFHRDWNTLIYNFGRTRGARTSSSPTRSTGWSSFHIDALRVDAVASMLYLDYSREAGRVDPERAWRAREPRGDRLPPRDEHARLRRPSRRDHDRRGIDRLAAGVAPGRRRRARLRLQVEHGLDARHARIHAPATRCTAATITTR